MTCISWPGNRALESEVILPVSKSVLNREIMLSFLSGEPYTSNLDRTVPRDCHVFSECIRSLSEGSDLYVHDAGTAMRFSLALACLNDSSVRISGTERLNQRPIAPLVQALRHIGADIIYEGIEAQGPLLVNPSPVSGGELDIDGSVSSQFISALMMIAPVLPGGLTLNLKGRIVSRPYIQLTAALLSDREVICVLDEDSINIKESPILPRRQSMELDWSAAGHWIAILYSIGKGRLFFPGLNVDSAQGDRRILDIYSPLGMHFEAKNEGLMVTVDNTYSNKNGLVIDCTDIPDMAQPIACSMVARGIACRLIGLDTLPGKETDRISALKNELSKILEKDIEYDERSIVLPAHSGPARSMDFKTYSDHRMVMSLPALANNIEVCLDDTECVEKSYPTFMSSLENAGFHIE